MIRLPTSMLEIYKEDLIDGIETVAASHVKLVRQNLRISSSIMESFFEPVVSGIQSCIKKVIDNLGGSVDVIYLVGGFGGCPYLYSKLIDEFSISYKCIVPPNPEYAVVEGSVLFHADPSVIQSRRADATYGKSVIRPFNSKVHDESHKIYDDDNVPLCDDLFQLIVEVGEIISPDSVYMCTSIPSHNFQTNMCVELFQSVHRANEIWYVSGQKSGDCKKIGEIVIDFTKQRGKLREVEFLFDFSHTEIKVTAYDKLSNSEIKTVIDFLSF